jgi:hypothetical protein
MMTETSTNLLAEGLAKFVLLATYFVLLTAMLLVTICIAWHKPEAVGTKCANITIKLQHHVTRACGFLSFYASDTLLALMLYAPQRGTTFTCVMLTYYTAQYLLYTAGTLIKA